GHQVDRADHAHRDAAADDVEHRRPTRVRLLRQREPGGGPPALEPGVGATDRGVSPSADVAVQRLCRAGRRPLCRHGSAAVLLMDPGGTSGARARRGPFPWLKPGVFVGALAPLGAILWRGWHDQLGANPIAQALNQLGLVALVFLIAALVCTPLKAVFGWT